MPWIQTSIYYVCYPLMANLLPSAKSLIETPTRHVAAIANRPMLAAFSCPESYESYMLLAMTTSNVHIKDVIAPATSTLFVLFNVLLSL